MQALVPLWLVMRSETGCLQLQVTFVKFVSDPSSIVMRMGRSPTGNARERGGKPNAEPVYNTFCGTHTGQGGFPFNRSHAFDVCTDDCIHPMASLVVSSLTNPQVRGS